MDDMYLQVNQLDGIDKMNEDKHKIRLGKKKEFRRHGVWQSYFVKPSGKFWKRFFNKKIRKGENPKKGGWFNWS